VTAANIAAPWLALNGIEKWYGPVHALRGADFMLRPGEVHALLGENGAGKTTLMRIAAGLEQPDGGTIQLDGQNREIRSPVAARGLGIGMVHQHFTSVPALTVAENIALSAGWPVTPGRLRRRVEELMERVHLPLDPDRPAGLLSVAMKQRLEILKALAGGARILLLDEPTAVLAPTEVEEVLRVAADLRAAGASVVLITHKLTEALAIADRVTVLRRGVVTLTGSAAGRTADELAHAMVGDLAADLLPQESPAPREERPVNSPPLVRAEMLDVARRGRGGVRWGVAVRQASLVIRAGEIVGIAAVEGNGQRELLLSVAGLLPPLRGRLEVTGPVAFVPEDRTTEGLIGSFTLAENMVLGLGEAAPWIRRGWIDWRAARRRTAGVIERFGVRASGPDAPAATLSGGNQQKLVLGRALAMAPRVLVAENPTRGLELHAAAEMHRRLREAAEAGAAVLVHASDLDEVLDLSTRVLVMSAGVLFEPRPGAGRSEIGSLMLRGAPA
jgi:simple sugar transport system ATP-binding protein